MFLKLREVNLKLKPNKCCFATKSITFLGHVVWIDQFLKVFVDDVNIHNQTWEEHLTHLKDVFTRLWEVNLKLNPG